MHYIQTQILKKLLFLPKASFTDLCIEGIESNLLTFHIKELIRLKYVEKDKNGSYSLTNIGKEYANRIETEVLQIAKQGKISAVSCARRKVEEGYEWLIYTRSKHPFWGFQGFPSGKVRYGESTIDAAMREFQEETGLKGTPVLKMIQHYIVVLNSEAVSEDKYFFLYLFSDPLGEVVANEEGKFEWVHERKLHEYITKPFYGFWDLFDDISKESSHMQFREEVQHVKEF